MKLWKIAVCVITLLLLLAGCDPYAGEYPFLEEAEWICDDPRFVIQYTKGADSRMNEHIFFEWDGEVIEADLSFRAQIYVASPIGSTLHDDRFFGGEWEYRNGDLVLIIQEDFIFDGKYKELVFCKTKDSGNG